MAQDWTYWLTADATCTGTGRTGLVPAAGGAAGGGGSGPGASPPPRAPALPTHSAPPGLSPGHSRQNRRWPRSWEHNRVLHPLAAHGSSLGGQSLGEAAKGRD